MRVVKSGVAAATNLHSLRRVRSSLTTPLLMERRFAVAVGQMRDIEFLSVVAVLFDTAVRGIREEKGGESGCEKGSLRVANSEAMISLSVDIRTNQPTDQPTNGRTDGRTDRGCETTSVRSHKATPLCLSEVHLALCLN